MSGELSKIQFDFRPGMETLMHVMRLVGRLHTIREDVDYKKGVKQLVFFDFSSAFDTIDHKILIRKCEEHMHSTPQTINMLKWYLNQIHIRVGNYRINQNKGSPQGGIVSPFLWLVYVNDLLAELESMVKVENVFAYADDLLVICDNAWTTEQVITTITRWSEKNEGEAER